MSSDNLKLVILIVLFGLMVVGSQSCGRVGVTDQVELSQTVAPQTEERLAIS
ncbi:MAG: hypothetical protein HRT44_12325, partial [Bdellovibrionales bacterium]|nr:hypothetical protein [Bdellovibrionales bacterium]